MSTVAASSVPMNYRSSNFGIFVLGQVFSIFGSRMASFGMSVWIYQETHSLTQFALTFLFGLLPTVLGSLTASIIIDRWSRRRVLILSDLGAATGVGIVVILMAITQLQTWHIYLVILLESFFASLHTPATKASIALLVPKEHLGRANGMMGTGLSIGQVFGPLMGGFLLIAIQLQGLLLIDIVTFFVSILTVWIIRIPRPEITNLVSTKKDSKLRVAFYGLTYVRQHAGLSALIAFENTANFIEQVCFVLLAPMVLNFASADMLGLVFSIGGVGGIAGGLVMSIWGGPKRRVYGILGGTLALGVGIALAGLRPSLPLITASGVMIYLTSPIGRGSREALWQSVIPVEVQGRVFAMRELIVFCVLLIASALGGPLAENIFEPLLALNGPLAGSIGNIVGIGAGRGIGLFYICMGTLLVLVTIFAYLHPRLRSVETEMAGAVQAARQRDQQLAAS